MLKKLEPSDELLATVFVIFVIALFAWLTVNLSPEAASNIPY